jgi:hypothetical protein
MTPWSFPLHWLSHWLSSNTIALISCEDDGWVAIVRDPGDRDDDALRALVHAPDSAAVERISQPEPLGPSENLVNWPCMVCLDWRLDAQVSVARRSHPVRGWDEPGVIYVRYCNDRERCTAVATADSAWPPEQSEWCIPALNQHANPHKECPLK